MGVLGLLTTIAIAYAISTDRKNIDWKLVGIGTAIQLLFAIVVLKTSIGQNIFRSLSDGITNILNFGNVGAKVIFGNLANPTPLSVSDGAGVVEVGAFFAFGVLPTIVFFSAFSAVLYHIGLLQVIVKMLATVMRKLMGLTGAESLAAAGNIFVGQTEAPLLVKPYLERMSRSELMALMTGGFSTVAGGVLAAYVGMLGPHIPDIAGHLLAASVMSAPAALIFAKIIVPVNKDEPDSDDVKPAEETQKLDTNLIDAASRGTSEGLALAMNVGAMLIAFTALIALLNAIVENSLGVFGIGGHNLQTLIGVALSPFAFLLGVPWDDARLVGELLGTKTVVNEFIAYLDLAKFMSEDGFVHMKSQIIATYALCGFSNFASIGIQIGGLTTLAPTRRKDLAQLGLRAMIAGSLACFQTAAIAGLLY